MPGWALQHLRQLLHHRRRAAHRGQRDDHRSGRSLGDVRQRQLRGVDPTASSSTLTRPLTLTTVSVASTVATVVVGLGEQQHLHRGLQVLDGEHRPDVARAWWSCG